MFSSGSAHLSQVVRESYAYAEASRRLRGIHAKVEELQQDRGIDSCWMGIGLATWTLRGDGQRPHAPVFLRRVRLDRVPGHPDDLFIEIVGDDGEMLRLPELVKWCAHHDIRISTIERLRAYREAQMIEASLGWGVGAPITEENARKNRMNVIAWAPHAPTESANADCVSDAPWMSSLP